MVGLKDFDMPNCCNSCGHWSFNRDDEPLCDLTYEYISQLDKRQKDCPLVETYTKADMVAMLTEIREKAWYHHSKFDDERDFEVDKAVEDIVNHIDAKINSLKEVKDANTKEK